LRSGLGVLIGPRREDRGKSTDARSQQCREGGTS
jgi:hypothetical protein